MVWPWFAVSWTPLKHCRVYLLRWHIFHTWLKSAHTTLSNLRKSSRNSTENFIHSHNFNVLLHLYLILSLLYVYTCIEVCLCMWISLYVSVYFLSMRTLSYITTGKLPNLEIQHQCLSCLSFLKNKGQFFFFFFFKWKCPTFSVFLMCPHDKTLARHF